MALTNWIQPKTCAYEENGDEGPGYSMLAFMTGKPRNWLLYEEGGMEGKIRSNPQACLESVLG